MKYLETDEEFEKLAMKAADSCKTASFKLPMLGTFDYAAPPKPEKERKERQRGSKQTNAQLKAPENITKISNSDQGAKKINIVKSEISRICREQRTNQLPYYQMICDPTSFMKSVDMAFQISFLIRDGWLGLTKINEEQFIVVRQEAAKSHATQNRRGNVETKQCVMSIDPIVWKQKVKQFNLRQAMIRLNSDDNSVDNESRSSCGQDEEMEVDSD